MNWLGKLLCKIGSHAWKYRKHKFGAETYTNTAGHKVKDAGYVMCTRCSKVLLSMAKHVDNADIAAR